MKKKVPYETPSCEVARLDCAENYMQGFIVGSAETEEYDAKKFHFGDGHDHFSDTKWDDESHNWN